MKPYTLICEIVKMELELYCCFRALEYIIIVEDQRGLYSVDKGF